jgi:hypothetical protein
MNPCDVGQHRGSVLTRSRAMVPDTGMWVVEREMRGDGRVSGTSYAST